MTGQNRRDEETLPTASFNSPHGIAVDVDGTVYVEDASNNTIRKITPVGVVSTLAGLAGKTGNTDGPSSMLGSTIRLALGCWQCLCCGRWKWHDPQDHHSRAISFSSCQLLTLRQQIDPVEVLRNRVEVLIAAVCKMMLERFMNPPPASVQHPLHVCLVPLACPTH